MFSEQSLLARSSRIQLRWTTESDLDAVLQLEQDAENRLCIIPWQPEQHRAACSHPDLAHLIIETRQASRMIGFLQELSRRLFYRYEYQFKRGGKGMQRHFRAMDGQESPLRHLPLSYSLSS